MSQVEKIVMADVMDGADCIGSHIDLEAESQLDLQASHPYSTHPEKWRPLIEVKETLQYPFEAILMFDKAHADLCGFFPDVRCAWVASSHSFLLYPFERKNGQCIQLTLKEEQVICAAGLAKCRPGDFTKNAHYILVLATNVEVVLFGVYLPKEGSTGIVVKSLYTTSSDRIAITCVACTNKGRIFIGGSDGNIHELQYTTAGGPNILRLVKEQIFTFKATDPVRKMVIDNDRQILYALTKEMKLRAYVFGPSEGDHLEKLAEIKNLLKQRDTNVNKPLIVSILPLPLLESKCLHLVAAISDGRRIYLSTTRSGSIFGVFNNQNQIPNCLREVSTRPSPPKAVGATTQNEDLLMNVETAYYFPGTVVFSDSSPHRMASLLVASRDSTVQSQVDSSSGQSSRALREVVSSLPIKGRFLFATDSLPSPDTAATVQSLYCGLKVSGESYEKACAKLCARGDLSTQHILPRKKIAVFTTVGVEVLVINRPVDIFRTILESPSPRSLQEDFFTRFGAGEAAAMCLMLAARIVDFEDIVSSSVASGADNGFQAMSHNFHEAKPSFTSAHEGICLCTSRLLFPLWKFSVMSKETSSDTMSKDGIVTFRFSTSAMQVLESKIRKVERFLRSRRDEKKGLYGDLTDVETDINLSKSSSQWRETSSRGESANKRQRILISTSKSAAAKEVSSIECIRQLLLRSAEALFLLQCFSRHHLAKFQGLGASLKQALVQLTFHQLVCSENGDQTATRLVSAMMENYNGSDGERRVDSIRKELRKGCPSYFKEAA
ncbi:hypothetical protein CARUB_v10007936mg [Capsella rubella]|uniref:Uncharacterized protein n=1 Tax=Capsella rubella TaxID=81985 RepID=R0ESS6_9BRAS|nr:nuclear pore complex protein NUP155 [Capsella rubella]EOA12072.1 hypothetical protein CARUB_v10007936mg [Capsella rubella]